jgi:hypothetical protein
MQGINFTKPLSHKVVSGEKTQTRRIVKSRTGFFNVESKDGYVTNIWQCDADEWNGEDLIPVRPRYKLGETLYLKEPYKVKFYGVNTFEVEIKYSRHTHLYFLDKFDTDMKGWVEKRLIEQKKSKTGHCNKLFMPGFCAKKFIEITGVRAERLQDISDDDCIKEGIYEDYIERDFFHYYDNQKRSYCGDCEYTGRERLIKEVLEDRESFGLDDMDDDEIREMLSGFSCDEETSYTKTCDICGKELSVIRNGLSGKFDSYQDAYAALIDSINGKGTWESNPFVWCYDFRLTDKK